MLHPPTHPPTFAADEHCDIREWVLHHATAGAGKFYVFDTQSEQPMRPVLEDLIASGLVEYHYVTNASKELGLEEPAEGRSYNWQRPVFSLCLERYGGQHKWMGEWGGGDFRSNPLQRPGLGWPGLAKGGGRDWLPASQSAQHPTAHPLSAPSSPSACPCSLPCLPCRLY